jgi:hypothetical protein
MPTPKGFDGLKILMCSVRREHCKISVPRGRRFTYMGRESCNPVVAVMQAAEPWPRDDTTMSSRAPPAARSVLAERQMGSVIVVVADVFGEEPFQVALIESDHMVQEVLPTASDPALRNSVLPRTLKRGSDRTDLHGSNRCWNF